MPVAYEIIDPATETRLLTVEPGDPDDPIKCRLHSVKYSDDPEYEALSYTWEYSILGRYSNFKDADLDKEIYGWTMVPGLPKENAISEIVKMSIRESLKDPNFKHIFYGGGGWRTPETVMVNGAEAVIGGELFSALRRFREFHYCDEDLPQKPLTLWIDALCINQDDLMEKAEHIQQMGHIYSKAANVKIWLGEEASDSDRIAVEAFYNIAKRITEMAKKGVLNRKMHADVFLNDEKIVDTPWQVIASFLKRSWFRRVWIIQEAVNAQKAMIHIGRYSIPWDMFAQIFEVLGMLSADVFLWSFGEYTADVTINLIEGLRQARSQRNLSHDHRSILKILMQSRHFQSKMPSDKIFAIYGLVKQQDRIVEPDYTISASEVYKKFAVEHIKRNKTLDILYHCVKSKEESIIRAPSWVPDWTQPCYHTPYALNSYPGRAAAAQDPKFYFCADGTSLVVSGLVIDSVNQVEKIRKIPKQLDEQKSEQMIGDTPIHQSTDLQGPTHKEWRRGLWENRRDYIRNIVTIATQGNTVLPDVFENLWRSFICNRDTEGQVPPPDWSERFSRFIINLTSEPDAVAAVADTLISTKRNKFDLTESLDSMKIIEDENAKIREYNNSYGNWCYNRRFFKTHDGRLGWGPDAVQEGDCAAVIYGLDIPLLLRPSASGTYEVVGDCFVSGLMEGQAFETRLEPEEITLV